MRYYVFIGSKYINFYKVHSRDNPIFKNMKKIKKSTYDFFLNSTFHKERGEVERQSYTMFSLYL